MSCCIKVTKSDKKEGYKTVSDIDGQIVVYGKKDHVIEIIGLLGQIGG